jgi:hypothetical protein
MGTADDERKKRLAQSLRDNLRRRKGQARESAAMLSDGGEPGDDSAARSDPDAGD